MFVADLFHPIDGLTVELFYNSDMRHRGGRGLAVTMLDAGRTPDYIPGPDFLFAPIPALRPAAAGRDDHVCPRGWVCHAVRAPGSKVTKAPKTRAGSGGSNR